jgi:hypothetical protein
MKLNQLFEGNRIGSAVRLDELPSEYRGMKPLGRGATTIAFQDPDDSSRAILFMRDPMKAEWITHGLHMAIKSKVIEPARLYHHLPALRGEPITVIIMPKLFSLDANNRRRVAQEMRDWTKISGDARTKSMGKNWGVDLHKFIATVANIYEEEHPNSLIAPLLTWLMDYDPEQYQMDLGPRQFKQTQDGKIVLLDPIVDKELMSIFLDKSLPPSENTC